MALNDRNPISSIKVGNIIYNIRDMILRVVGALALKDKANLSNGADVSGILPIANGGSGLSSSPSLRVNLESESDDTVMKASPRPGIYGILPVGHGGTGAVTPAGSKLELDVGQTNFTTFSGTSLSAANDTDYTNNTAINSLAITLPGSTYKLMNDNDHMNRRAIFGVNFTSSASFTGVTFPGNTVQVIGDGLNYRSKRYNLVVWHDGQSWWCAVKAK